MGDQVIAPPSTSELPAEVPTWVAQQEAAAASASPREEAIADLLRGALAQGHSDEALAGILRKVLAGASPQAALPEPVPAPAAVEEPPAVEPAPAPVIPEAVLPEPVFAEPVFPEPVFAEPVFAEPVFAVPVEPVAVQHEPLLTVPVELVPAAPEPVPAEPAPALVFAVPDVAAADEPAPSLFEPAVTEIASAPVVSAPVAATPVASTAVLPTPVTDMWSTPSSSLWGESAPAASTDTTVWAEPTPPDVAAGPLFPAAESVEEPVVEEPVVEAPVEDEPVEEEPVVEEPAVEQAETEAAAAVEETVEDTLEEAGLAELAPVLARTASDPAPMMSLDSTTVMPPLSLLPPLPSSRGRGRPPVPPASRPSVPRPSASSAVRPPAPVEPTVEVEQPAEPATPAVATAAPAPVTRSLATVTRLPVAPSMAGPEVPEAPEDVPATGADDVVPDVPAPGGVTGQLVELGVPRELLGSTFAEDVAERGTYAALTRALALRLPKAPEVPSGAGEAVFVVGPGVDALRAARSLAAALRLDPDRVQWATRGDLAGLAPKGSRVTTVDAAIESHEESLTAGTVTIVAVDAPLRSDAYWMAQMTTVWSPVAVWAVVEATRKPEDLEPWIDSLPRVDALIVQDTDLSADPAAVLRRIDAPVALLDGVRATPHRWASLLCERLESTTT